MEEGESRVNNVANLKRLSSNYTSLAEIDKEIETLVKEYRQIHPKKMAYTSTYDKWS